MPTASSPFPPGKAAGAPLEEVLEVLAAATEAARRHHRDDLVARLDRERDALLHPRCHVLVVGEFKKGKSSLINALLNARICATDAERATAVPTLVRYGSALAATVVTAAGAGTGRDGGTEEEGGRLEQPGGGADTDAGERHVDTADIEDLATHADVTSHEPTTRADRGPGYALEVTAPRELLRDGLVLVDTPGVGGGLTAAHAAATLRALTAADVVLFVSDASAEYTRPELDFFRQAADLCPTALCALTKIDFYPEWRRILDADREHLRRAGLGYEIVPLSAPLRQHGVRSDDLDLVAESGYPRLAALLRQAAAATAGTARAAAAAAAHAALAQLSSPLLTEYGALSNPDEPDDRRTRWLDARQRAERLRSGSARWQQTLNDGGTDLSANARWDLPARLRQVHSEAADRIAAEDPLRAWPQIEPWLHQRTNEALLDHFRLIRVQADTVADDVARQFGAAAWELQVAVEVNVSAGVATAARLGGLAQGRSRFEQGLLAARAGSTGLIVSHAAGLLLGLALPMTLPATAMLATVLARKTWRSASASQLRALRAEADRAVTAYLAEVELAASKDSEDTVRQVLRQLRETFSQRAAELYTATVRNLEALTKAVQEDERSRQSRLAEVSAELDRLRALTNRATQLVDRLLPPQPPDSSPLTESPAGSPPPADPEPGAVTGAG